MPNTLVRSGAYGKAALRNYGSVKAELAEQESERKAGNVGLRVYASSAGERRMIRTNLCWLVKRRTQVCESNPSVVEE